MTTQSRTQSGGGWLLNTIKQNPEGLLLLAAGAVLMMRQKSSNVVHASTSLRGQSDVDHASSSIKGGLGQAQETVAQSLEAVGDTASEVYRRTQEYGRSMGEQSKQLVQNTNSVVGDTFQRVVETQPFAVALAGLAAGAAVAAVLPVSELEQHTLAPTGEHLTNQVKDAASKAGEKLTEVAKDRLTEGIKTVASEVAGTISQSLGASDRR
jgi:hypothetical protein